MEWASTHDDRIFVVNSQMNGILESIHSLREKERRIADDAKAFQEVIWGEMELITARKRNEEKLGYNGNGSISDTEGRSNRSNRSNSVGVVGGLDQMVRKEVGGEVMNFGEKDELEWLWMVINTWIGNT